MAEPFLGEIIIFAGNFAPMGWCLCQGQLLSIAQYQPLFSLLGTTYGGDGRTNFQLPDLRGRAPIGFSQGSGLSNYNLGQNGGAESTVLTTSTMPAHSHAFSSGLASVSIQASSAIGDTDSPGGHYIANTSDSTGATCTNFASSPAASTLGTLAGATLNLPSGAISNTGGSQPFDIRQPYLAVNYIIAFQGVYPTRS